MSWKEKDHRYEHIPDDVVDIARWRWIYDFYKDVLTNDQQMVAMSGLKSNYWDHDRDDAREERLYRCVVGSGYNPGVPPLIVEAGAEEYEEIMAAEKIMDAL